MCEEVERAILAVEAQQEARNLLAIGLVADDHAVAGLVVLDLLDDLARPRLVGAVDALGDDAVETDDLESLVPVLRGREVGRRERERESLRHLEKRRAGLGQRARVARRSLPCRSL